MIGKNILFYAATKALSQIGPPAVPVLIEGLDHEWGSGHTETPYALLHIALAFAGSVPEPHLSRARDIALPYIIQELDPEWMGRYEAADTVIKLAREFPNWISGTDLESARRILKEPRA